ncbi:ankyrin repeat domain-containing protein [Streptomyces sp. NPDC090135]|uniref:ankyrin repeat domain-containing protein n=1 Tax=Streptomyces sp. NPDC090135 TaxID=3365957 RepID=UPI0038069023
MDAIEIDNTWTPAHQAVGSSDHAALARLLDEGADVDEVCCRTTLLMHAIELEADSATQAGQPVDSALTAILWPMAPIRSSSSTERPPTTEPASSITTWRSGYWTASPRLTAR